jgi:tripartite-type tricarboxylate transporter receptor subunit TctC
MVMRRSCRSRTSPKWLRPAKAAPNDWTFAIPALGAPSHLATVDFMQRTGVKIATSPYRGTAPALTDVIGAHVQLLIDASFALLPAAKEGRVKALGITTKERSPLARTFRRSPSRALRDSTSRAGTGCGAERYAARDLRTCQRTDARGHARARGGASA